MYVSYETTMENQEFERNREQAAERQQIQNRQQEAQRIGEVERRERNLQGWSWLQIFFSALMALLIARLSTKWYLTSNSGTPNFYPDMKFNSSTLYPTLYISDDETIITNRKMPFTSRVTSEPSNLHRYTGVILNKRLSVHNKMYFEVKITYRVIPGPETGLLFEIGFEDKEEIDKLLYLRNSWGTTYVRALTCGEDHTYICLTAHDGKNNYGTYKLSDSNTDKTFDLRLGFHINPDDDVIKVTYSFDNNKRPEKDIYRFISADIDENKWPVFAMYNPHKAEVTMELSNAKNLLFDKSTVHPMIYISDNGLKISNVATKTTSRMSYRQGQLQKYEGVIGNISFDTEEAKFQKWPNEVHFDIMLEYNVTSYVYNTFLFEIGMSRLKYIDKHWSIGPHRYSVSVFGNGCNSLKEICLYSEKDKIRKIIAVLSSSKVGTHFKDVANFAINFSQKTFSVTILSKTFVYHDVDFTEPMWPVFAMYKHSLDTLMALV